MITRAHLVRLLHQLKTVHINPSIRFSTAETPLWTSTTAAAAATQSNTDDFLKYGSY